MTGLPTRFESSRIDSDAHMHISQQDWITARLEPLAESGNRVALDLLATIGSDSPTVIAEAERRVAAILVLEPKTDPHEGTLYAVDAAASISARHLPEARRVALAEQWLRLAQDTNDAAINRAAALQ